MMLTENQVLDALRTVQDPELHQSIVDLQMVRGIRLEPDGDVDVDLALTVAGCPLHQRIKDDVEAALAPLSGEFAQLHITLGVMNDEERRQAFGRAFALTQAKRPTGSAPQPERDAQGRPVINTLPGQGTLDAHLKGGDSATTVIGVASGKGGVGKSTVTANLAVALHRLGYRVGVMDMDIYGFSQGRMFGGKGQAQVNAQKKILPWEQHGVYVVSMGMFVEEDQAIIWRGPMLGKMMSQFFSDVAWPPLDYLLIDLPPGTGDVALEMAQRIRQGHLVLVTTPQEVATHVARRAADVAQRAGQPIIGVIENMSYLRCPHGDKMEVFGQGGGQSLARQLDVPFLGQIPLEPQIREAGDIGTPDIISHPDSEAGQAFLRIAQLMAAAAPGPQGADVPSRP